MNLSSNSQQAKIEQEQALTRFHAAEQKAVVFPSILKDSIKAWIKLKTKAYEQRTDSEGSKNDAGLACKHRNLPVNLIVKESVHRFQEVIGVRPEMVSHNIFNKNSGTTDLLDWTIERPKSKLACSLLELIRVSIKDLRKPDF